MPVVGAALEGERESERVHTPVCGVVPDALEGDAPGCVVEGDIGALFFLEVSGERGSDE